MKSLKYLNKYLWKYRYRFILGILFVAISNVFAIYPAQIIREAFDAVANSEELRAVTNSADEVITPATKSSSIFTKFTHFKRFRTAIEMQLILAHLLFNLIVMILKLD